MIHIQALGMFIVQHPLALLLCVIAYMIIGSVWYGPLFMKPWVRMSGLETMNQDAKKKAMVMGMTMSLVTGFVIAVVLGRGIQILDMSSVMYPLVIATILWIPFTALPMAQGYAYTRKPFALFCIDAGYLLVSMWAMSLILYKTVV